MIDPGVNEKLAGGTTACNDTCVRRRKERMTVHCHQCGESFTRERVGVRDVCDRCAAYLHCCRNCDFYAPGTAKACREPNAELVADKTQGNFCDYFRPAPARPEAAQTNSARAALDALFRKK